jgi:endonuclease/exonuclease/phosphatase family metal-dependent hydrolase
MHTGAAMGVFDRELFTDADPTHSPTIKKGPLKAQIDRILRRGNFVVVSPTVVESSEGLSDHQRIRATVQLLDSDPMAER